MSLCDVNNNSCKEKICIETRRVFDACVKQIVNLEQTIQVTDVTPEDPVVPLTFVSGRTNNVEAEITDLVVDVISTTPRCGRARGNIVLPVTVHYTDDNDVAGSGSATVTIPFDIIVNLPQPSILPYEIRAVGSGVLTAGEFTGTEVIDDQTFYIFDISICATIIIKVIVLVDIVIPIYGYAVLPPCTEYSQEVCQGFFELPIFPSSD